MIPTAHVLTPAKLTGKKQPAPSATKTASNAGRYQNENLSKSISTIADTDAASEVASMAKNKILLQTSQSMLAQANQKPRHVLTLIEDS